MGAVLVDKRLVLANVDFYGRGTGLPVRGDDNHGFGLDLLRDLAADVLQPFVGWMFGLLNDGGTTVGEEVDWCPWHGCVWRLILQRVLFEHWA